MGRRRIALLVAGLALLAACGDETTTASAPPEAGGNLATIAVADTDLGSVLVDGEGFTVYLFEQDTDDTSTCYEDCATTWPAVTSDGGDPIAGDGADAALLGTTDREDDAAQVTYAGHPLYRYSGDAAPGDTNGNEVGDVWYAVNAAGEPAGEAEGDDGNTREGY